MPSRVRFSRIDEPGIPGPRPCLLSVRFPSLGPEDFTSYVCAVPSARMPASAGITNHVNSKGRERLLCSNTIATSFLTQGVMERSSISEFRWRPKSLPTEPQRNLHWRRLKYSSWIQHPTHMETIALEGSRYVSCDFRLRPSLCKKRIRCSLMGLPLLG